MRQLFGDWARINGPIQEQQFVESPPEGLLAATDPKRSVAMIHPILGTRKRPADTDFYGLVHEGWIPDYRDPENFLESVHIQAYYFQTRFFPRFHWFTLRPPKGESFVIADRAVGWASGLLPNATKLEKEDAVSC
jgi:hypothetical protein